jgi:hypothetical protein
MDVVVLGRRVVGSLLKGQLPSNDVLSLFISKVRSLLRVPTRDGTAMLL